MKKENIIPRRRLDNETETEYKKYLREFYFDTNKPQPETRYQFAHNNNLVDSEEVMDGKDGAYIKYLESFYNDYYKALNDQVNITFHMPNAIIISKPRKLSLKLPTLKVLNMINKKFNFKEKVEEMITPEEIIEDEDFEEEVEDSYVQITPNNEYIINTDSSLNSNLSIENEPKEKLSFKERLSNLFNKKLNFKETVEEIITSEEIIEDEDFEEEVEDSYVQITPNNEYIFNTDFSSNSNLSIENELKEKLSFKERLSNLFNKKLNFKETVEEMITPEEIIEDEDFEEEVEDSYVQITPNNEYIFNTDFSSNSNLSIENEPKEKPSFKEELSNLFTKKLNFKGKVEEIINSEESVKESISFDVTPDSEVIGYNLDFDFNFDITPDDEEMTVDNYYSQKQRVAISNQTTEVQKVKVLK